MKMPETIIRVYTKYDSVDRRIAVPLWGYCLDNSVPYHLTETEKGLEGVVFAHYIPEDIFDRLYAGGFIGEVKGKTTFVNCKISGELNIEGRTNG